MTTPYPAQNQPQNPSAPQQVRYNLGTAKLNRKFGTLGTAVVITLGVVLAGGAIWYAGGRFVGVDLDKHALAAVGARTPTARGHF